jgi:hypothetical protein
MPMLTLFDLVPPALVGASSVSMPGLECDIDVE